MNGSLPQLGLVLALVVLNAAFAGSEMALISLREGQLHRLERASATGRVLAGLARDPNRFLATIQVGITMAGFLASATAAVALAEPLEEPLAFLGGAAGSASIVLVTLVLAFVTLVLGELAPKRVAMQRAERWALVAARPLSGFAALTRPLIWLLARSTDLVVRLFGGDPTRRREAVTEEEVRDLVAAQTTFSATQHAILSGAFEIGERKLREIVVPRGEVTVVEADDPAEVGARALAAARHSRAPAVRGDLDGVVGVVHLVDLLEGGTVGDHLTPAPVFPETVGVLDALRTLQAERRQMAVVVNEHGGAEGIITIEDLLEELVGEIYDDTDPDVAGAVRDDEGALVLPGTFPVHDLGDIGVDLPDGEGDYATIAGLVLSHLGHLPVPGETVAVGGWRIEVLEVTRRAITRVRVRPEPEGDEGA